MATTEPKIKISGENVTTTIKPVGVESQVLAKAIYESIDQGMPSNEELNKIGDQLSEILEEAKLKTGDEKTTRIIQSVQNVVEGVQTTIQEKNYDEKMQDIARKLKEQKLEPIVEEGEFSEDSEMIKNSLKEILPLLTKLGRDLLRDKEFRELLVSILDIGKNTYYRAKEVTKDKPQVLDVLKEEVKDTSKLVPEKTGETIKESIIEIGKSIEITDTEREELINRSISALLKLRKKAKYKEIFVNIFKIFDGLTSIWDKLAKKPILQQSYERSSGIMRDIQVLIERSCGRTLRKWEEYVKEIAKIVHDPLFLKFRKSLEDLVLDYDNKYTTEEQLRGLIKKIRKIIGNMDHKYNRVFENMGKETTEILYGIANDPFIAKVKDQLNIVVLEAFTDSNGNPSANVIVDSITKLRDVFFPIIKEKLKYVAIPTIEVESDKYYFNLSDITFKLADIIPDMLHIETESNVHIDIENKRRYGFLKLRINFSPFNTDIEKLRFNMKKYKGLRYRDYGVVDLHVRKAGILFEFEMKLEADKVDSVKLETVKSSLGDLTIKVIEAKHNILDKIITTVFLPVFKANIRKQINETLYDSINSEVCDRINDSLIQLEQKKKV